VELGLERVVTALGPRGVDVAADVVDELVVEHVLAVGDHELER